MHNLTLDLLLALVSETYPSGRVVTTAYDGANRVSQVSGLMNGLATTYAIPSGYCPHGEPEWITYGNTLVRGFLYNSRLQPTYIADALNNSAQQFLSQFQLNWGTTNNNGNLLAVSEGYSLTPSPNLTWLNQNYSYDGVNRLTAVSDSGYSRAFAYDPFGNGWVTQNSGVPLAGNTPVSNVYAATGRNQISGASYDAAGNQLSVNGDTMVYDAEDRRVSATDGMTHGVENYFYGGAGQRVEKAGRGGTTVYVYDALGQLAAEYSTAANIPSCTTCYLSSDHLGSIRLVTDQIGNVVARHDYLPFGEEILANTVGRGSQWGSTTDVTQNFTGKERDGRQGGKASIDIYKPADDKTVRPTRRSRLVSRDRAAIQKQSNRRYSPPVTCGKTPPLASVALVEAGISIVDSGILRGVGLVRSQNI